VALCIIVAMASVDMHVSYYFVVDIRPVSNQNGTLRLQDVLVTSVCDKKLLIA
jgi:hypothetical protein